MRAAPLLLFPALLGLCAADSLPSCVSLSGGASIISGNAKCKVCGNYCGPSWCAAGVNEEGPACANATPNWNTQAATDPTDSCCQAHGA